MNRPVLDLPTARAFVPLLKPARYKGAHGGRGSGKSHFFCEALVERALIKPTRAVCLREIQKTLKHSVKQLIEDKIQKMGASEAFRSLETHIEAPNGGIILFQGMQNHTSDSIKSLEGFDVAFFEEAQNCSERSLELLTPTIREDNSEMWFAWNPNSPKDPIDKFFRNGIKDPAWRKHPSSICVEVNYPNNPWFPGILKVDMEYDKRRDPDRWSHVWMGKYRKHSMARVFKNWRIGEEHEFVDKPKRPYYGGDWGFSVDPSVAVRCYFEGRTLYIDREVWAIGCDIDHTPALFDRLDKGEARRWPMVADSARPEIISYMNRHGYPKITAAKKGAGSVEEGVTFLQSFDIVVHPDCKHVIEELTEYSYKVDPLTNEVLPVLEDRKNHTIDSCRYAVEATRRSNYTLDNVR